MRSAFAKAAELNKALPCQDGAEAGEGGEGTPGPAVRRRLEDEPLLAARIVVEDCLNLLLDADDIDRLWASANIGADPRARDGRPALRQRRTLLLEVLLHGYPMRGHSCAGNNMHYRISSVPSWCTVVRVQLCGGL